MSIKTILFAVLGSLGLLLLVALTLILSASDAALREATLAKRSNEITDLILSSSGAWAQERGLTNLELNAPLPAPPDALARIHALRKTADDDYARAVARLPGSGLRLDPGQARTFDAAFSRLKALRAAADRQLALPGPQRDQTLKSAWFPAISAVIEQSQLSAVHIASQTLNTTTAAAKDAVMRHNLWLMSEYAGRERGLMAGIIASGRQITPDQMGALAEYRAYVQEGWKVVSNLDMRADEKTALRAPIDKVRSRFFGDYDAVRTRLLAEGVAGRPYELSATAWFDAATVAIGDILALERADTAYVDGRLAREQGSQTALLWLCAAFLLVGAGAVAAAFWLVNRHVLYTVANLNAIFENASDGLITIDASGIIKSFNPACERIFRTPARDAVGQNIKLFMAEPEAGAHDAHLLRYLKTGEARIVGRANRETTGRRGDGELFPMDLSVSRFELEDGVHFCGVIRDVTTAHQAERDRQALLEKLIESNTELERFAYVASHDMQEPVRMVVNFSQIVVQDYGEQIDDRGREYLQVLSDSAHRMLNMIHDLLQYARLSHEGETFGRVDMAAELGRVKLNLSALINETSAVIDSTPLPVVQGNAVQLQRVLQNLISNAIKYQPPGRRPHIQVSAREDGGYWTFEVSDNGLGIDAQYFAQIFEPFRRLHGQDQIKGTGFGLSIVRKIIDLHGGKVTVSSTPGEGSTFSFGIKKT
jgi:PAS domain S-box-containing protein